MPHFEKMLYDNALLCRVYAHLWRSHRLRARPPRRPGDRRLHGARTAHERGRVRLRPRRRQRGRDRASTSRARTTCGRREQLARGARRGGRRTRRPVLRRDRGRAPSRRAPPSCNSRSRKVSSTPRGSSRSGSGCSRRGDSGPPPAGTTRSSPPGTASRSPRSPRPAPTSTAPTWSRPPSAPPTSSYGCTWTSTPGSPAPARTARSGANAGVLEDYADVAEGFLALASVTGEGVWLEFAGFLLDHVLTRFADAEAGALYDTAADAEQLIRRPQDPTDNATPSGWTRRRRRPAELRRADRCRAPSHRRRAGAGRRQGARPARAPLHRLGARGRRGAARRAARGGRRRARHWTTRRQGPCTVRRFWAPRPGPWSPWGLRRVTSSRCSPTGRSSTAHRPRTSAVTSPATRRRPIRSGLRAALSS